MNLPNTPHGQILGPYRLVAKLELVCLDSCVWLDSWVALIANFKTGLKGKVQFNKGLRCHSIGFFKHMFFFKQGKTSSWQVAHGWNSWHIHSIDILAMSDFPKQVERVLLMRHGHRFAAGADPHLTRSGWGMTVWKSWKCWNSTWKHLIGPFWHQRQGIHENPFVWGCRISLAWTVWTYNCSCWI